MKTIIAALVALSTVATVVAPAYADPFKAIGATSIEDR